MAMAFFDSRTRAGRAPEWSETVANAFLDALAEPAAVCSLDGAIRAVNQAWREIVGPARRLPRPEGDLFAAFLSARSGGHGKGALPCREGVRAVDIARLGDAHFLLRVCEAGVGTAPAEPPPDRGGGVAALDPLAAASPFGAALIEAGDPLEAPIVEVNDSLRAIVGQAVPAGARLGDLMTARARADVMAGRAAGRPGPYEVTLAQGGATTANLYLAPAGARTVAYLMDVTDQKTMQRQLAQRAKMEAVGQLAGGVAHDFNNMLTAIRLRADELLLRHPLGDPAYDNLSEIRQIEKRAAEIVSQLLAFSRKATLQRENLDLGEALTNVEVLLRRLLREDVKLTTDYGRDLPRILIDRAQLENAVMNLIVNARDAVLAGGGGAIRLRAARIGAAEALTLGFPGRPPEELALIEVADDGAGIAPEVIANIFEPFFTTKRLGEGTGLGLAMVYGIVKQSEGWICVRSTPGEGAAFRIFLPVHVPPLTVEQPASPSPARPAGRDLSGAGRILFVEDEPLVRGIAARLLRARGYEVIEAADGDEALALARRHAGEIDLMISDVIMPGIDGPALLKAARPFLGSAPVIFVSGYAEAEFSDLLEEEAGVSFLAKPLDIQTLAERVKQAMRAR